MKKNNKQCFRCEHFQKYYTKGNTKFVDTKCGRCSETKDTVTLHQSCGKWEQKKYHRFLSLFTKIKLNDILIELTEIRQIIEENENEKNL